MSTKFTTEHQPPTQSTTEQTSPAPPLNLLMQLAWQRINQDILDSMADKGYEDLTPSHLNLFSNLDCGITQASAVARQMGITRQAIFRTTKELQKLGYLTLEQDPMQRNQKQIKMTQRGMALALDARAALAQIEIALTKKFEKKEFEGFAKILRADWDDISQ